VGDNIFDINIDFEDLGDDQPIFDELKDVQEPSLTGPRVKRSSKKPATAQKKALNKNNKSILSSSESTKLKTSSTKQNTILKTKTNKEFKSFFKTIFKDR
jgi:hypothetical protein